MIFIQEYVISRMLAILFHAKYYNGYHDQVIQVSKS